MKVSRGAAFNNFILSVGMFIKGVSTEKANNFLKPTTMQDNKKSQSQQGKDMGNKNSKQDQKGMAKNMPSTKNLASGNDSEEQETNLGHTKREHNVADKKNQQGTQKSTSGGKSTTPRQPQQPNRGSSAHR